MSRHIDADKLLNLMDNEVVDSDEMTEYADKYKEDVLPVIHAKWEPDEESSVEKPCYRCSNCGAVLEEDYNWHNHNFCYHCGARMDGEENESS